jgi:putative intracellular protease/amidase
MGLKMMWKKTIWKKIVAAIVLMLLLLVAAGFWLVSLLEPERDKTALKQTLPADLPYLQQLPAPTAGKVLAVVTSTAFYPPALVDGKIKKTGYELTELARFYWVLRANGFAVDIASPQGGNAPQVLDDDDMAEYDYSFLNDPHAQHKTGATLKLADVNAADYRAIYFVGGKGAMYDFPQHPEIRRLLAQMWAEHKLIVAVCHGPAAFISQAGTDGQAWLHGKKLTSFTNEEELLLMPDAQQRFGFLLQSRLSQLGAEFVPGPRYLPNLVVDGNLITGQNPWSVWQLAEATVRALGVTPRPRLVTAEEQSMQLLQILAQKGDLAAEAHIPQLLAQGPLQRDLILMMALVSGMAGNWSEAWQRLQLAVTLKQQQAAPR